MPRVIFSEKADADLDIFVGQYEDSFLRLYVNSGIWNLPDIAKIYEHGAKNLYDIIHWYISGRAVGRINFYQ